VHFLDELLQHLLGDGEIAITPSFIGRIATMLPASCEHHLRFLADRLNGFLELGPPSGGSPRPKARRARCLCPHVDQRIGRAQ